MAGQGSESNAYPGKFYFGRGPNAISHLCNQNVDSDDLSQEEMQSDQMNTASSANVSLQDSQLANGPSAALAANSSALFHNIDLNAAYQGNDIGDSQEIGGSDTDKNAPASDSSNSNRYIISSGIAGYVLDEDEGGDDSASGGWRISCKRRAPEDAGQLSLGESLRSVKQGDSFQQPAVINQENAPGRSAVNNHPNAGYPGQLGDRLVVGVGAPPAPCQSSSAAGGGIGTESGTGSEMHQNSSMVRQAENSQRNIRLRSSESQSDSVPDNLSAWTTRNPHVQSPGQLSVFYQFNHLPSSNTAAEAGMVRVTSPIQPFMGIPNSSQTLQTFQWNEVTRARTGEPSTSSMNGGNALHQDLNLMNDPKNGTLPPEFQRANLPNMSANLHFANGRDFAGNIPPIPQNGSSSTQPSAPTWFPQPNMLEHYPGRMPDLANRTEPRGPVCYRPFHLGASPAAEERELSEGSGNTRPSQMPLGQGLAMTANTETATREMTLRALISVQRRNRLATEKCVLKDASFSIWSLDENWGASDVMLIDRSAFFGDSDDDEPDEHQDMRLDVDNMSYEQLLALEEQMGNVSTGLSEDAIVANLKRWKYQTVAGRSSSEDEPCCICQEEYADEDDLGKLKCGHHFHFNCIREWLAQKNNCPICKKPAVDF
ncbi:PREDICTED: probable E3 ubiquitin-protein ligase HIP1 [Populus euphratica]|uniref:RING-type E3 ubiquitin transferase n=1 Tax=Populus euphratica TaxID=75702 RepID=A0AAJ6TD19_POPEU|nr:PREDICTED: probable E3 ubiquitin-protein ligase HIP1 [Populus euphratica]